MHCRRFAADCRKKQECPIGKSVSQPFFSIGITTYNRPDLLKEALESILAQDFHDFEVIVGNDYQAEVLTGEVLGISDPRIRFINHPRNLREIGNMNALLGLAEGRYFTWLFDDDLYEPGFLRSAHEGLAGSDFPPALFPSHRVVRGAERAPTEGILCRRLQIFDGREYLKNYFSGRAKIISTCGLFDAEVLRRVVGGVEEMSASPIGLYSEYFFLVRCALLGRIAYMDAPFVVFRAHSGSWGETNVELATYLDAGEQLIRRSEEVLRHPDLRDDYERNLLAVCKIHLSTFSYAAVRVERSAGASGVFAAVRAASRVLKEISRVRKILGNGMRFRTQLRMVPIIAKCMYLVGFAVAYYEWRKRKERRNAS
jgi:glycosyltransferase involved in cell wall biosynthesis